MVAHAAGRGGTEADRPCHQAPAGRAEGRARARRAPDLARRRAAHHHPLGARRFLLVGIRAAQRQSRRRRASRAAAGPCAQRADQAREHHLRDQPAARRRRPEGGGHHRRRRRRARSISPIPAAWAARGPASARRASATSWPTACGGACAWPDGEETEALIVAPLDSPRLTRLLGQFVDAVRRFKAGDAPVARTGLCVEPGPVDSATAACDRRLVDVRAARGAGQARPVRRRGRSLLAARRAPAAAVRAGGRRPARGARAWPWARCRSPRRAAAPTCGRS